MAFLIGLCHHIKSIFVTQIIPDRIVGIVTSTNSINIKSLHQLDVLYHSITTDNISTVGIHLMSVDTFNVNRLSIDQQLAVLDFNLFETNLLRNHFNDLVLVLHRCNKSKKIWSFCRPCLDILNIESHRSM